MSTPTSALRFFIAAAACGVLHAAFSGYWAAGGTWMLGTVGAWAEQWVTDQPVAARVSLAALTLIKLLAATLPLLAFVGLLPLRRLIFGVSWVGALVLIVWGGMSFAGAAVGLALSPQGRSVKLGHLFFDGVFFLWGASLLVALVLVARTKPTSVLA